MKYTISTLFFGCIILGTISCNETNKTERNPSNAVEFVPDKNKNSKTQPTDFLNQVLLDTEISEVQKCMKQYSFTCLDGVNEGCKFETKDEKKVLHTAYFVYNIDNLLTSFSYNLDFKNSNTQLVSGYHAKLQNQLQEIYGDDFTTGYDDRGLYIVDWYFEAGILILTMGIDFISVEVKAH